MSACMYTCLVVGIIFDEDIKSSSCSPSGDQHHINFRIPHLRPYKEGNCLFYV